MIDIIIYGAGNVASYCIPELKKIYNIQYVLDKSVQKQGQYIHELAIVEPSKENLEKYPVLILIDNITSAVEMIRNLNSSASILVKVSHHIYTYVHKYEDISKNLCYSILSGPREPHAFFEKDDIIRREKITETEEPYQNTRKRFFNICLYPENGTPGGPRACLRNLKLANDNYHIIPNFYTIALNCAFVPKGSPSYDAIGQSFKPKQPNDFIEFLNQFSDKLDAYYFFDLCDRYRMWWEGLSTMHEIFHFSNTDVFLLQEVDTITMFHSMFPQCKNIVCACHHQGTIGRERGGDNQSINEFYNEIQSNQLKHYKNWLFPSKGSIDGFINTCTDEMRQLAGQCTFHVAYNGYEQKQNIIPDNDIEKKLSQIEKDKIVFATTTHLNYAKGVERIPHLLATFKALTGMPIYWVLVGGGEMESVVEVEIKKYLASEDYCWFKNRFDNQDNIFALFERADFYIMMHRISIFDLATLQAMFNGCIPVLSNVGGNKEFCNYDNGILIEPDDTEDKIFKVLDDYLDRKEKQILINRNFLELQKAKNSSIVKNNYNNEQFLKAYYNVLLESSEEN